MENPLFERLKNHTVILLAAAAVLGYFLLFGGTGTGKEHISGVVRDNIAGIESYLQEKVDRYKKRGEHIYEHYKNKSLKHTELQPNEALALENDGVVVNYFGEMFHFDYRILPVGSWALSEKNRDIYFTWHVAEHVFYVRHFFHQEKTGALKGLKYPFAVKELKYSGTSLDDNKNSSKYDERTGIFYFHHMLEPSNRQLILNLKLYNDDVAAYYARNKEIYLFVFLLAFLLVGMLCCSPGNPLLVLFYWLGFLAAWIFLVPFISTENMYLVIGSITIESIFQVFFIVLFVISIFYYFRKQFKIPVLSYVLFNVFMILAFLAIRPIYKSVDFNTTSFSLYYVVLLAMIFLLHLWPLFFIRGIANDFYKSLTTLKKKITAAVIVLCIQVAVILVIMKLFRVPVVSVVILSLIAFILMFFRRTFFSRVVVIFLLAISVFSINSARALHEKKEFVEKNLKNIFLNQSNYALYIAREIHIAIKSSIPKISEYYKLFEGNKALELEGFWRKSLASRENVASGIFVVSKEKKVLSQFSFQVPYLDVSYGRFSQWALEEATAVVKGKEIPLATAYIKVLDFKNFNGSMELSSPEELGRVVVQVLNSPELLVRYQEKDNIFNIYNKVDGRDFSYIKLNQDNQILENPSNINPENISGILDIEEGWSSFKYMDLEFTGYIFRNRRNTFVIYFPKDTLFKQLAEVIRIFLFFSLLFLLFYTRYARKIEWRNMYYSFSIRVFLFLVLISLLTAVVFSIFFINFNSQKSEQQLMQIMYENGRTAQSIGYDLMKRPEDFHRDHLFSISTILNSDVSVYDKKGFVETSNLKKIIDARIPEFLHSRILMQLNDKKQKFVLEESEESFRLYFKVYDHVFMLEFPYSWKRTLSEKNIYTDFIITMFFMLVIIGVSTALIFRHKILSPISGLHHGMARVEKGELPILTNFPSEIEIKSLYMGFNSMIKGIREQKRNISEISRMKTIIRMGRRVAHEVKNPLTPIKLSAEQILLSLRDKNPNFEEIIKKSVDYIIEETDHLKKVSYGFLDLSRMDEINAEEFDLMALVHDEIFSVQQLYAHISFSVDGDTGGAPGKITVKLDKVKIKQVLKNLINNSIEALGEKPGELSVSVKKENQRVLVVVYDTGVGMDKPEIERAFEADYSTKEVGTGLGLFIVKRIVESHKGHIEIQSEKDRGTRVIVDLPEHV